MTEAAWDSYLATARERYEEIDRVERYKIELGRALTRAREALLRDERDWPRLVKEAIGHKQNNIVNWRNNTKLIGWIDRNVDEARGALFELWSEDGRRPGDRVRSFDAKLPESVLPRGATGTRLNAASYFMMGIDPARYPPYRRGRFRDTYRRLGYPPYSAGDIGGEYEYALEFLDCVLEEARRRSMSGPSTRLDAQSVVWMLQQDSRARRRRRCRYRRRCSITKWSRRPPLPTTRCCWGATDERADGCGDRAAPEVSQAADHAA